VLALVLALPSWAARPRRAELALTSVAPLVVRGVGFGAGERVAVIASYPGTQQIVNVTARRNGSFRAIFTLTATRCTPLTVRAIGSLRSRAILQRDPGCEREKTRKPGR
jgi:hypothetical protein